MSLLENYQIPLPENEDDTLARDLYRSISETDMDAATPRLHVRVTLGLENGKSVVETIPFEVPEERFTDLQQLVRHYLASYKMLHMLTDNGTYLRAYVVKTSRVTYADIIGERVEINDEDIRRGKFTAAGVE